jgi:STE24 endopeptidase
VRGVYRFDMSSKTRAANAAVVGLGNTRRIILGDTLIESFTGDEIETVLAHELGHHVHGDVGKGVVLQTALTLGGLHLASRVLAAGSAALGLRGIADVAGLPLLGLVLGVYGLVTMPLENTWSRWRETLADRYSLRATGKAAAFASAMTRLANQNLGEVSPPRWVEVALMSHPALGRRIAMARRFAAAAGG